MLPLQQRPFFPVQAMPLSLNEQPWLETIVEVGKAAHRTVGLVLARTDAADPPRPEDLHAVGTAVRLHNSSRQEGRTQFVAEGRQRFRVRRWISTRIPYVAQVEYLEDEAEVHDDETRAYAMAVLSVIKELVPLNPLYNEELKLYLERFSPNQPLFLAFFAANLTTASGAELQAVLEEAGLKARLVKVLELLNKELDVAKLQTRIRQQVEQRMTEQQREFFLREQLKAIQKELGIAKDDRTAEAERFRERLQALEPSDDARRRIDDELDKLSVLETGSPEYAVTRNYLDWITSLPWGKYSEDILDLERARRVLDSDHTGLDDVKERIVEFLAVGKLRGSVGGSILLLVGPPGVGKTSIGRSVADSIGREFFRFSVGGMRDEAEIKGHRRTYIGAMPGKFIQALKDVEVANPVLMLDEVDKIGASYQGDPASALLEALDPEQNADFLDHYLDVRFDLSKVLFVCTANQLDTIPAPLLDRMETIRLAGYISTEKVAIAKHHLWPRQLARAGLKPGQIRVTVAAARDDRGAHPHRPGPGGGRDPGESDRGAPRPGDRGRLARAQPARLRRATRSSTGRDDGAFRRALPADPRRGVRLTGEAWPRKAGATESSLNCIAYEKVAPPGGRRGDDWVQGGGGGRTQRRNPIGSCATGASIRVQAAHFCGTVDIRGTYGVT